LKAIRAYFNRSRLTAKLTRRMAVVYLGIYVIILVLLLAILTPRLYRESMASAHFSIDLVRNEFESLHSNMQDYLDFIAHSDNMRRILSMPESPANTAQLKLYLHNFTSLHEWIFMTAIQLPSGTVLRSLNFNDVELFSDFKYKPKYLQLVNRTAGRFFSPIEIVDVGRTQPPEHSVAYFSRVYVIDGMPYIFTLFMGVDSTLRRNNVFMSGKFDDYLVMNQSGDIIITSDADFAQRMCLSVISGPRGDFGGPGGRYLYTTTHLSNWVVIAYASYYTIFAEIIPLLLAIVAFYLISPILYFIFLVPTNTRFLAPLSQLSNTMKAYNTGDNVQYDLSTGDEIEDLADSFNEMVDKIKNQLSEIAQHEHETSLAKYKLLTTQIDPHFVYNTMNIINALARQGDGNAIIDVNTSLVRILQDRLSSKERVFDTIRSEVDTLKQYINIMDYRYQNNVKFTFDVDEKLWDAKIPKNVIQPFVENAFIHGLTTEEGVLDGEVQIMIYKQKDSIIIEISDSGCGMSRERMAQLKNGTLPSDSTERVRIGVDNVRERLEYIYGIGDFICINSTPGSGTTVVLDLPYSDIGSNIAPEQL